MSRENEEFCFPRSFCSAAQWCWRYEAGFMARTNMQTKQGKTDLVVKGHKPYIVVKAESLKTALLLLNTIVVINRATGLWEASHRYAFEIGIMKYRSYTWLSCSLPGAVIRFTKGEDFTGTLLNMDNRNCRPIPSHTIYQTCSSQEKQAICIPFLTRPSLSF